MDSTQSDGRLRTNEQAVQDVLARNVLPYARIVNEDDVETRQVLMAEQYEKNAGTKHARDA